MSAQPTPPGPPQQPRSGTLPVGKKTSGRIVPCLIFGLPLAGSVIAGWLAWDGTIPWLDLLMLAITCPLTALGMTVTHRSRDVIEANAVPPLRVLIANEQLGDLETLAQLVTSLGHEVVARETDVGGVGGVTAHLQPDVALVQLGASSEHALGLVRQIVHESECPVIALLSGDDPAYVREAGRQGVFACIVNSSAEELQSTIDITLQRFREYHDLQGAFGRRAVIEQAKGILMGTRGQDADGAFAALREHSQSGGQKIVDVAVAVVATHRLVVPVDDPRSPGSSERDFWRAAVDVLPNELAVLDAQGEIVAVNEGWRSFAQSNGGVGIGEGANYLRTCEQSSTSDQLAGTVRVALQEMLHGDRDRYECVYPCHAPWGQRWYCMRAARFGGADSLGLVVSHHHMTGRTPTES